MFVNRHKCGAGSGGGRRWRVHVCHLLLCTRVHGARLSGPVEDCGHSLQPAPSLLAVQHLPGPGSLHGDAPLTNGAQDHGTGCGSVRPVCIREGRRPLHSSPRDPLYWPQLWVWQSCLLNFPSNSLSRKSQHRWVLWFCVLCESHPEQLFFQACHCSCDNCISASGFSLFHSARLALTLHTCYVHCRVVYSLICW